MIQQIKDAVRVEYFEEEVYMNNQIQRANQLKKWVNDGNLPNSERTKIIEKLIRAGIIDKSLELTEIYRSDEE
ncbi:MAG: hypothetical protein R3Y33_07625 [Clostridia bacterium]